MPNNKIWEKIEAPQAPAWNGKNADGLFALSEGDEMIGKYQGCKAGLGPRKDATIFLFKQENEEEIGVWGSAILLAKLSTLQIGENVKIVYKGDVQGKNKGNNPYHDYDVYHSGKSEIPVIQENDKIGDEIDVESIPFG